MMTYKNVVPSFSSVIALTLALAQPLAAEETSPAATAAPAPTADATPAAAAAAPVAEATAAPPVAEMPPMMVPPEPPAPPMMEAPRPPTMPEEMAKREAKYAEQAAERQAKHEKRLAERKAKWEKMRSMTPEERWKAHQADLSARYQDLRRRAAENGVQMPETAPWEARPSGPMSAEGHPWSQEQMPSQAPPMPPQSGASPPPAMPPAAEDHPDWEKLQAVIDGMTPEEREACTTVHRLSMSIPIHPPMRPLPPPPERGYGPEYGSAPGYGAAPPYGSGYRAGPGYGPGYGYGYGPGYGYYGRGMGNAPDWSSWQGYSD